LSRTLSSGRPGLGHRPFDLEAAVARGAELLRATACRSWWVAAAVVLVLGGAAAGLHAPTSGTWFWHMANGELIHQQGLGGAARYLARSGPGLDLRSWLVDLGVFLIYAVGGLDGLEVMGAVGGALVGLLLLLAIRSGGRAHPLVVVIAGALGLVALAPLLTDLPTEGLALLGAGLLLALVAAGRHGWWGMAALVGLVVVWTNTQADAGVLVLVLWGWLAVAHWESGRPGRPPAPSWWLIPLTGVALLVSPRGIGTIAELPLSLGMQGEHPLLVAWSSLDFHPWSGRVAELAGLVLLLSYWLAGSRLRRADAYLGLVTAALALLWANYLPWFLVVAAVQSSWYLSVVWRPAESERHLAQVEPPRGGVGRRRTNLAAAIPVLVVVALLASGWAAIARGGGASGQTASALPVKAAGWLATHPEPGAWLTTPSFGDYLGARFPSGRHLLCVDDPLPLAGKALGQCEDLTVLNAGALGTLQSLHAERAVLPRTAPQAAFLRAEGWKIRYRDSTTVVLAPRNL